MDFYAVLDQVIALLRQRQRVTYRALKRQFALEDDALEDLTAELLYSHPQVRDDAGQGLVWTGDPLLAPPAASVPMPPQDRAPLAYTPPYLAEKILTSRHVLEGERKQVTVLFCDITNSTSLAERLGPETMHGLLSQFFELALSEIHRYEGTINQFLGDGFMALFGAPIAHEDHAWRAILAAVGLRQRLAEGSLGAPYGVEVALRMGLNTGQVIVGVIGDNLRMDYTAVGDTTNIAARLQSAAVPGQIMLSEATHRLVAGNCTVRALGAFSLKGKHEPVHAWEVLAIRGTRTRLEIETERGLTPFVGRERELHTLRDCFVQAQAGHGQVVFLMGEAGIGKSRLLVEFHQRLAVENCLWLHGRCLSYGRGMPYLPIIGLVKHAFQIDVGDDNTTISAKIEHGITSLGEALSSAIPHVKNLLSVPPGDNTIEHMDAQQRRLALFEALRALVLRLGRDQPLILLVEDLHWIDTTSEDALRYLADSIAAARVVLLLTYRPGYHNPFGERTYFTRLVLPTLTTHESLSLAEGLLTTSALPAELRALLTQKAEGNPFFLEEILKALLEAHTLTSHGGRYILTQPLAVINIPETVQDVLMARIDRLAELPKKTLQLASVIGREFTVLLLDHISDLEVRLEPHLQELKVLEFIYEHTLHPELVYMFKHALTHDVAYNSLLMQRRKGLHCMVAMAIEELYAERLAEFYEMLAYHYEQGEVWEKALVYLVQAGQKAQYAYANQEALVHYDRALAVCERLGMAVEPSILLRLYDGKGAVHFLRSEFHLAIDAYQRVLEVTRQAGDRPKEAEALYHIGFAHFWAHEFDQAIAYAEQTRALALEIDAKNSLAASTWVIGKIYMVTGKLEEAVSCLHESLRMSREAGDKGIEGLNLFDLGILSNWQGDYEQALQLTEQGVPTALAHNLQLLMVIHLWIRGLAQGGQGAYEEALASLKEGLELSERLGDQLFRCRLLNTLGWVYGELYNFA
jgi:class 3 adenylate cyclase/tetratricopeptide (TPR) repeat protein